MIKGYATQESRYSTNAEVLRLLLKNDYLHEVSSSSEDGSDGQFTQGSSSSPHAQRSVQLSPAFLH